MRPILYIALLLIAAHFSDGRSAEEWKSRVGIYQLLTDRFSVGEVDPSEECTDLRSFCGGTYSGIISKLDYLEELGIDAIWISPIPYNTEGGYHGYWAEDLYRLSEGFGPEEDLSRLIDECHARDIWVMLDVVPNHMGLQDDCNYDNDCPVPPTDFTQFNPFNLPEHYHEFCEIEDFDNQTQLENCRLALLADLDQSNDFVNQTLHDWIAARTDFGFDGYRVDTTRHIAKEFYPPYQQAANAYLVGEVASEDTAYVADYQNYMDAVLNFPMYYGIRQVFNDGNPMSYLKDSIASQKSLFPNINYNAPFVDNHDQPRFLSMTPNLNMLKSSLSFTFFIEGIPILYYGTEQAFDGAGDPENRESLWPYFDPTSEMYIFMKDTLAARRALIPAIVDNPSLELYSDEATYVFLRGTGFDVIVAISSGYNVPNRDGYTVEFDLGPAAPIGSIYNNIYDPEDILIIFDQVVSITFDNDLPPKVYKKQA